MTPSLLLAGVIVVLVAERVTVGRRHARRSSHDRLTGLAGREVFERRVDVALAQGRRHGFTMAVLFVDLDRFQSVNDGLGYRAGDRVLVAVAERLREAVRGEDTVARVGGDEFTILLEQVADLTATARVADRVLADLRRPVLLDGRAVYIGASIGVATATAEASGTDLVRDAATAAQQAKAGGGERYEHFDPALGAAARHRLALEAALRQAVDRHELHLVLEPQLRLDTEEVVGLEARARWTPPGEVAVEHDDLLRLAVEAGLQGVVGRWLLAEACRAGRRLQWARPGLQLHVDVAAEQLSRGARFVQDVADIVRATGFPATSLVLEAEEHDLFDDSPAVVEVVAGLRAAGVQVAVAGFGTGASSLARLKHLPVSVLKLDPSVLVDGPDGVDRAITRSMLQLAEALGLRVVAEGIDTRDQHLVLRGLGCSSGQGRWLAEPMGEDELADVLAGDRWAGGPDLPTAPRQ